MSWRWVRLARRFPHVQLNAFAVMPNHIHGIIINTNDVCPNVPRLGGLRLVVDSRPRLCYSGAVTISAHFRSTRRQVALR